MAVIWSWAFGPETPTQLQDDMGWTVSSTNTSYVQGRTDYVYSYPGSPTRYAMATRGGQNIHTPTGLFSSAGWATCPIFAKDGWNANASYPLIEAAGNTQAAKIYCSNAGTGELTLYIYSDTWPYNSDVVLSGSYSFNDWHYIALKYDFSGTTGNAEAWINGALVGSITSSYVSSAPASAGRYKTGGFSSNVWGIEASYTGQIVVYDTGSLSSGNPYDPVYCTRLNPTADTATSGTWTPSVGSDDYAVLSSSFDSSTHTVNTGASSGEFVTCQASIDIATQIGTSPGMISGITLHAWASGSGLNGKAALSNNNTQYDYGDVITPDINDPTYCFFTAPKQVQALAQDWQGADVPYMRYELTGS